MYSLCVFERQRDWERERHACPDLLLKKPTMPLVCDLETVQIS